MLLNVRKLLLGFALSFFLLPAVTFASTEFKGTETVNINKANAATLAAYLKGIGPSKAEAIVKYRKSNGSFKSAADIINVPGVGDGTYKDIKSKISTSRGKSVEPKGYKLGKSSSKSTSTKKKSTSSKTTSTAKKKPSTAKTKSSTDKKTSSKKATTKKTTAKKKPSKTKTTSKKKTTKKKPVKKKTTKKTEKSS